MRIHTGIVIAAVTATLLAPVANADPGTRFTNDATGHGMFVSVENVDPF